MVNIVRERRNRGDITTMKTLNVGTLVNNELGFEKRQDFISRTAKNRTEMDPKTTQPESLVAVNEGLNYN